jgi:hypothetical protein
MGDESWCFMYDPETKPKKPKALKIGMQKSQVKTMLTAFFDAQGIIHHEFIPCCTVMEIHTDEIINTIEKFVLKHFPMCGIHNTCTPIAVYASLPPPGGTYNAM